MLQASRCTLVILPTMLLDFNQGLVAQDNCSIAYSCTVPTLKLIMLVQNSVVRDIGPVQHVEILLNNKQLYHITDIIP